ncbi:elastase-1-like [Xenentodon cancila]
MFITLLLTSLTATVLAQSELLSSYTGISNAGRVVGGQNVAYSTSWPWQVSLQENSGGVYRHFCGGVLISTSWVMTAAHCVYSHSSVYVVFGDLVLYENDYTEQTRHTRSIYIHPEWNMNSISSGNDIALLLLSSEVKRTSYVYPVNLPKSGEILLHGHSCYITGYGRISTGGAMSARMRQAVLRIVDRETCTSSGWWGSTVKTTMICAGGGAESACNGDFGGPLSCLVNSAWYVHGIASFVSGMGCNAHQKPTVFTRVSAYIPWINSVSDAKCG